MLIGQDNRDTKRAKTTEKVAQIFSSTATSGVLMNDLLSIMEKTEQLVKTLILEFCSLISFLMSKTSFFGWKELLRRAN
jgi:hypothetical protein